MPGWLVAGGRALSAFRGVAGRTVLALRVPRRALFARAPSAGEAAVAAALPDAPVSLRQQAGVAVLRTGESWSAAAAAAVEQLAPEAWVLIAHHTAQIAEEAIATLVDAAERGDVDAAQPVVVDAASGTVRDAGILVAHASSPPWRILEGHPEIDLPASPYRVAAIAAPVVLVRGGLARTLPRGQPLGAAIGSATAAVGGGVVVPSARARASSGAARLPIARVLRASEQPEPAAALRSAGLEIDGWSAGPIERFDALLDRNELVEGLRDVRPVLRRTDPRRRWAIRIGAPAGPRGDGWGDTPFAEGLAAALERAGQQAFIDRRGAMARPRSDQLDDVTVSIRGLYRMPTNPSSCNILWVISHPDWVSADELRSYDLVAAASEPWARRMARVASVPVLTLLQATDASRFHPGSTDAMLASDVLFVGRTREVFRPIVRDALRERIDVDLYGDGWEPFVDARHIRAQHLPNIRAAVAYRSARRVLNDHWPDMAEHGFLSNRLFDAVASGARVVTDPIEGLERFGGAVRAYHSPEQLRALVMDDDGWPDEARMRVIADRVRLEESFDARAATLIELVEQRERACRTGGDQPTPAALQATAHESTRADAAEPSDRSH
ncbi:hypothetical protein [Agrococcus sp. Ld7]|uniref:glycosyltransferase family protein n=1 Tax=Agrococcus sp. Ld7 TaxID=649148 RepID=UPI0038676D23